ncbi:MAG: hypothetical protein LBP55_08850 [Candidatus Adiutrix sp.]|jgi:hypothetical protein|nr:hypothetical protein [Candidatus Adiutrix sp.]
MKGTVMNFGLWPLPVKNFKLTLPGVFGLIWLIIAGLTLVFLPLVSKLPQKYTDLFIDQLAFSNLNKSGELRLFTLLVILGLGLLCWLDKKTEAGLPTEAEAPAPPSSPLPLYILMVNGVLYALFSHLSMPLLILSVIYLAADHLNPRYALKSALLWFFSYGSVMGLTTAVGLTAGNAVMAILAVLAAGPIWFKTFRLDNEKIIDRALVLAQAPIPLLLFIFLEDRHLFQGEMVVIPHDPAYRVFFYSVMLISMAYNLARIIKMARWPGEKEAWPVERLILISTICCLAIFLSHSNSSHIIPTDWHHYGERVDPWNQIVSLGQSAYREYFPPSGLFPLVDGFFLNVVLDGAAANIYPALSLEAAFFWLLIALGLAHIGGRSLALAAVFLLPLGTSLGIRNYERYHLMTLSLILLGSPPLLRDLNKWLKVWVILTCLNLMYYPLFGAAIGVSGAAVALPRLWLNYQSRALQSWLKKPSFWIGWLAVLTLCAPFIPLVARIVAVSAAIGSEVVQSEARAVFGEARVIQFHGPTLIAQNILLLAALLSAGRALIYLALRLRRKPPAIISGVGRLMAGLGLAGGFGLALTSAPPLIVQNILLYILLTIALAAAVIAVAAIAFQLIVRRRSLKAIMAGELAGPGARPLKKAVKPLAFIWALALAGLWQRPTLIMSNIAQFITLSTAIIIPAYLVLRLLKRRRTLAEAINSPLWYFSAFGLFFLPMAYQFSIVGMDYGGLNRAGGPVAIALTLAVIGLARHGQAEFSQRERAQIIFVALLLLIPYSDKLDFFKQVDIYRPMANQLRITAADQDLMPRLGAGFIDDYKLAQLNDVLAFIKKNDLPNTGFYSAQHLLNYILGLKALAAGYYYPAKGFKTSRLYYEAFKDKPFVGYPPVSTSIELKCPSGLETKCHGRYHAIPYIYYWLLMDKKLRQTPEGYWVSPELVSGQYPPEELKRPTIIGLREQRYFSSFGRSMESLRPLFQPFKELGPPRSQAIAAGEITGGNPSYLYEFAGFDGLEADHIFLKINSSAIILNPYFQPRVFSRYGLRLHFRHNGQWDYFDLDYGDGQLLIPVGLDTRWLFETIDSLKVEFTRGFAVGARVSVDKLELLKLDRYRDKL